MNLLRKITPQPGIESATSEDRKNMILVPTTVIDVLNDMLKFQTD